MTTYLEFCERMVADGRFATINEHGRIVAMILFSVCNDPEPYLNNIEHTYIPHDPTGKVLVIEDMVASHFKPQYIKVIKDIFYKRYPQIEKTMWRRYRLPEDKIVTYYRRSTNALKH